VQTDVFVAGKEGYHTFRIPSLLVTPKGTLLAFCEGRKTGSGDHGDVDLVLKRSGDGGKTWGALQLVHEEGGTAKITIGNPCPVVDSATGTIFLTLTRDNDDVLVTTSKDDGVTWSKPEVITKQVKKAGWTWYATGPGVGIQLREGPHKGRLLIPCDHREPRGEAKPTISHCFWSDDGGKTWQLGDDVALHTNECQAVELPGGGVLLNMRNYWGSDGKQPEKGKMRAVARSKDGGKTWGGLTFDKALPEPVCQASLIRYSWAEKGDKGRLLFSNPATQQGRNTLTVKLSTDDGATWPVSKVLCAGPSAYSCLAALPGGEVGCLYERGEKTPYEKITLARFPLDWLTGGK
jgi:sialidase-1